MHVNPYLTFKGECETALKFYAKVLDGKVEAMMRFADMPGHAPANWNDKVMHGSMKFGDNVIMGSDAPPERYEPMKGVWVSLQVEKPEDIAANIRAALKHIPAERLILCSDCGMGREGMSRRHARYKMVALVQGTNIVRKELGLPEAECLAADERYSLVVRA